MLISSIAKLAFVLSKYLGVTVSASRLHHVMCAFGTAMSKLNFCQIFATIEMP